jgi:hypothetical protein
MKKNIKDEISAEEWSALEKRVMIEGYMINLMALVESLGEEGAIEALRPHLANSSNAFAINIPRIFRIEGSIIERIAAISQLWDMLIGASPISQDIETFPDKVIRAGFTNCVYISGPKVSCVMHRMIIEGLCEAIDPAFECRFMQIIPNGDPMCSYVIEKKKK